MKTYKKEMVKLAKDAFLPRIPVDGESIHDEAYRSIMSQHPSCVIFGLEEYNTLLEQYRLEYAESCVPGAQDKLTGHFYLDYGFYDDAKGFPLRKVAAFCELNYRSEIPQGWWVPLNDPIVCPGALVLNRPAGGYAPKKEFRDYTIRMKLPFEGGFTHSCVYRNASFIRHTLSLGIAGVLNEGAPFDDYFYRAGAESACEGILKDWTEYSEGVDIF